MPVMNRRLVLGMTVLAAALAAAPQALRSQQTSAPAESSAHAATGAPTNSSRPLPDAKELYWSGKLDAALEAYRALAAGPEAATGYAGMARVYLKQKQPAEASTAAAKAVELGRDSADAHSALGDVLFRQGKILESQKEFLPFVKADTKEPRSYLGMYRVYRAASYYKSAKVMIDQAYALDPADPDIRRAWSRSVSLEEQIKDLEAFLAANPGDSKERQDAVLRLGILRARLAQPERPCRLSSKVGSTQEQLERLMRDAHRVRGFGLKVKLNSATGRLLLDTGASGILVNRKLAEKAGLERLAEAKIGGIGSEGEKSAYIATAETIQIGELEFRDCFVQVIEKNSVLDVDGLIGGDVFSRFLVELDFPDGKFKLSPLPADPDEPPLPPALESRSPLAAHLHNRYIAPEMKSFTPVFRFGHQLLVETQVNDSPPRLFMLDTGAFDDQISPEMAREYTKVRADPNSKITGLSGKVDKIYTADNVVLGFGRLRQVQHDLWAWDLSNMSDSLGTEVSGILGFRTLVLLDIKIDYRDGLVDFEFDRSRVR